MTSQHQQCSVHCTLYHDLATFTEVQWSNVSVPYLKPGLAENFGNVELRAAPLVQHFCVLSLAWFEVWDTDTV